MLPYVLIVIGLQSCVGQEFGFVGFGNSFRYIEKEVSGSTLATDSYVHRRWITQPLDHFDGNEKRTWSMRYYDDFHFWRLNGPIFLFIGGEGEASPGFLRTGVVYELAKETNGGMLLSEHRYYGKSKPVDKLTPETLKYLSARQALADLALLLRRVKRIPLFRKSKIVVVGGSYAGNLAAWMKLLYPDLVDAGIASSAPVLAKADFFEYLEAVGDDYEQYGTEGCYENIEKQFQRYDELFKSTSGIEQLKQEEKICEDTDMSIPENQQLFVLSKASQFMVRAQYGSVPKIRAHCEQMYGNSTNGLRISIKPEETDFWDEKELCYDYDFDTAVKELESEDWAIPWIYQTCTEYGYFQSTSSSRQPFSSNVPVDWYYKLCTKAFGPEFNEERVLNSVEDTNIMYGGLAPNVSRVVFVNGDLDPWSRLSILEDLSYEAPAKVIPQASHCRDLFSNREGDPEELKEGRQYVKYLIKRWIGFGEWSDKIDE